MPRKGEVWTVGGKQPRTVLVVSGNMYNDLPDWPYVLTMETISDRDRTVPAPITVPIGDGQVAVVDTIRPTAKPLFERLQRQLDNQAVSDVHNALFRILAAT